MAVTVTTLASFNGSDGINPNSDLISDASGDLFGTTISGGATQDGTVFEIPKTSSGYGAVTTLASLNDGGNGNRPFRGLVMDAAGDLFGTAEFGGSGGNGTVFELSKTSSGYGAATPIVAFTGGNDGSSPLGNLIIDAAGDLFGTTETGGGSNDGTVFEVPKTSSGYGSLTTLASFDSSNGAFPTAGLTTDAAGDLFGTTETGGGSNAGTVFEIPKTSSGYGSLTTLVSFNGADGATPFAGMMTDAAGDLFGTTFSGGGSNDGTVFEIPRMGSGYGSLTTLVSFNNSNGASPNGLLTTDAAGNLFGTTFNGGANDAGTVFEIPRIGSSYGSLTTLVSFNSSNGSNPFPGDLTIDAAGDLFGTTQQGGSFNDGTVFEILRALVVTPSGQTPSFNGGSNSPVNLDNGLTLSDQFSSTLIGATVSIGSGFLVGDTLSFTNGNGITGSYDSALGILTLSGTASVGAYQAALQSVTYSFSPSNQDPTSGNSDTSRAIDWSVNDGIASGSDTSTLNVAHAAPSVTPSGQTPPSFTGGSNSPVTLDSGLGLTAPDSSGNISGATISISGHIAGDQLNFANQNGITGSYNATTGKLTLSGTTSAANYQAALDSITYSFSPTDGDPTGGGTHTSRTIAWVVNDGVANSAQATSALTVAHTAPTVTPSGQTPPSFAGGGSAVTLDSGLSLSAPDSAGNLSGATVSIGTGFINGDTLNFTNTAQITGSYDAVHGILTLSGTASAAAYTAALDSITYSFTAGGDPTGGNTDTSRTIDWTVNDGVASSTQATSSLNTSHTAPTVTPSGQTPPSFTGGGSAVTLDSGLSLSTPDSNGNISSAQVSIGTGFIDGDTLNFTNTAQITGSYDAVHGILTLSGVASATAYQAALDSITYSFTAGGDPTSGNTDTSRTIGWVVNDGVASSTQATSSLNTSHAAPTVAAGAAATFVGGGSAVTLDSTLSVTAPDSGGDLSGATVSIGGFLSAGDGLNFTNGNGITGSYDPTTGVLTLSGIASVLDYQAALQSITYSFDPSSGESPSGTKTITWAVNDGTSNGTDTSTLITLHTAPTVTAGATTSFTGGGSAVTLDNGLTLTAPDSGGNLSGATISIGNGFLSGDALNFTNTASITGSYDAVHGILTLSGTASATAYQAALDSITYSFTAGGDPTSGNTDTSRIIDWVVNDGVANSTQVTSALTTVHVAPTVTAGSSVSYVKGRAAAALDGTLTVSDPDSGGNLTGATVSIGSDFSAGDTLNFTNTASISGSYDAVHGILTLSGTASVTAYQSALQSITFTSTSRAPGSRTIDWTTSDGVASSTQVTSSVNVIVGPQISAGATANFTGGGSPATLDSTLALSDPASSTLVGANVSIGTGFLVGDMLNFINGNGITGSYDATTGVLTLSGTATAAAYQAALQSVTYSFNPPDGDPTGDGSDVSRTIDWVANDGSFSNTPVTSTLFTTHVAPTVTAGATATFDGGGSPVAPGAGLAISAPDSGGELTSASVTISAGFIAGDTLNFTNGDLITGSYDAATGVLSLSGTASVADYLGALQSVTYSFNPVNGDPTHGGGDTSRTLDWNVGDGVSFSNDALSTLNVAHVAPSVAAGPSIKYRTGDPPAGLGAGLAVSDPDSGGNLTGATVQITGGAFAGDGDVLAATTTGTNIHASYNAATETLTLSGADTLADYQSVLDGTTFSSGTNPTNGGSDPSRTVTWTLNDGNSANGASTPVTSQILLGDFNTALVQAPDGTVDFLAFQGSQLLQSDSLFSSWNIKAEGDFNGQTELVSQNPTTGQIDLLFVNNGGGLQQSDLLQGDYWNVVGAGDFDGSGRTGIATQNTQTGQVDLLWFTGTQLTGSELLAQPLPSIVGAADFSGDGKTDLVGQTANGQLDFLFFNGTQLTGSALTPQSYWAVNDVSNYGAVGNSEMISQDPVSGQLDYLKFNGTNIVSTDLMQQGSISPLLSAVPGSALAANLFNVA